MFKSNKLQDSILVNTTLTTNDYYDVTSMIESLINENEIKSYNIKLPGIINFVNFYNMIINPERFMITLQEVIEDNDEDIEEVANYLVNQYSNMGLSKEFYLQYLNRYM